MIISGECRRCGGDLALERDRFGVYMSCIQCGAENEELSKMISKRTQEPKLQQNKASFAPEPRSDRELTTVR